MAPYYRKTSFLENLFLYGILEFMDFVYTVLQYVFSDFYKPSVTISLLSMS